MDRAAMRNAMALSVVAIAWVIVIQVVSGVLAPDTDFGLADAGFDELGMPTASNPDLAGQGFHEMIPRSATIIGSSKQIMANPSVTPVTDATGSTIQSGATTTSGPGTTGPGATGTTTGGTATTSPPGGTTTTRAGSGNFNSAHEAAFIARVNNLRTSVGAPTLTRNAALDSYARSRAQEMGLAGAFTPNRLEVLLPNWRVVGENVAYGPSVQAIFQALVDSVDHYNNMVDKRFTDIGTGAFVDANGRIWTCHVFGG